MKKSISEIGIDDWLKINADQTKSNAVKSAAAKQIREFLIQIDKEIFGRL